MGLSSYAIDDLLLQDALLDRAEAALGEIVAASSSRDLHRCWLLERRCAVKVGSSNTAVVIYRGEVVGAVPKSYLPNYREFYERRHFAPGVGLRGGTLTVAGHVVRPELADLLFRSNGSVPFTFHVEICEDIWVPLPPSTRAAMAVELLLNLSASNITIGKARHRRLLCASHSARCVAQRHIQLRGRGN